MRKLVVCCGLPKTGTKSIIKALNILGYKAYHYPQTPYKKLNGYDERRDVFNLIVKRNINAIAENAAIIKWRKLYKKYPNSKFILTIRDLKSWLESCKHQLEKKHPLSHKWVNEYVIKVRQKTYGSETFNKRKLIKQYKKHNKSVKKFFKNKKHQFLLMNIIKGDGWEKLCTFLNKPIPKQEFPHKNKRD